MFAAMNIQPSALDMKRRSVIDMITSFPTADALQEERAKGKTFMRCATGRLFWVSRSLLGRDFNFCGSQNFASKRCLLKTKRLFRLLILTVSQLTV